MEQTTTGLPPRGEIAIEHTWDARSVFPNDAAWEEEMAAIEAELPDLAAYQGRLSEGPTLLAEWLSRSEAIVKRVFHAFIYPHLSHEGDTADQAAKANVDRAQSLLARVFATIAFARPELLSIGFETLHRWTAEEQQLAIYAHAFDQLERHQAHVRSAEVEQLLGMVADPFGSAQQTHGLLADADLTFRPALDHAGEQHTVAQGTIDKLLSHPDRVLRRAAWESYADAHFALRNTMANCLGTGVRQNVFLARARHYGSSLEAALSENDIPVAVFHNLIAAFKEHLPIWHRYWQVRRRALGQDDITPYDIWAPLTHNPPRVPFDQALEWIAAGLQPLGDDYVTTLVRGVTEQRWVDKYPNAGKRAGAFSTGVQGTHPFLLINYTDDLESMSTLAHELGHSLHSYYTWRHQPPVYADYTIFVAEVASNFNQALVRAHLFEQFPDRDFQLALINEAMSNFHRYFFLMPTLARFEIALHEQVERGESPTSASMNGLLVDLFREAYGPDVTLDPDRVGITWAQFPTHLYANFYVYQYATGLAGAHALAQQVLAGTPGAVDRYLTFLRAGSADYPLTLLQRAGVDLTTPEPVHQTFGVLESMIDRLEQLIA